MKIYRPLLTQALLASWQHKSLWFFGFWAAFLSIAGSTILIQKLADLSGSPSRFFKFMNTWEFFLNKNFQKNLGAIITGDTGAFILMLAIFLVLAILFLTILYLSARSYTTLVISGYQFSQDQEIEIKKNYHESRGAVWPVLMIYVLLFVSAWLINIFSGFLTLNLLQNAGAIFSLFAFWGLFIIYAVINFILFFTGLYGINASIIKNTPVMESLSAGWKILRSNWLASLEMIIATLFIALAGLALLILGSLAIYVPLSLLSVTLSAGGFTQAFILTLATLIILLAIFNVIFVSWISTFINLAWTNFFLAAREKQTVSKLLRASQVE